MCIKKLCPLNTEYYEIEIKVKSTDIDLMGHVNNVVYLRYIQDAAVAHWTAKASDADQKAYFWVVTRHEIDYKRPAFLKDIIIAKTWVGAAKNGLFERFTALSRKEDGKLIAQARTIWCPVDPQTKRPIQVGESVYKRFSTNRS